MWFRPGGFLFENENRDVAATRSLELSTRPTTRKRRKQDLYPHAAPAKESGRVDG